MNERIKELAKQAEKLADEETKAFTDDTGQWRVIWNEVYDKKFAELIVRECCSIADEVERADTGMFVSWYLKAHFGVKE